MIEVLRVQQSGDRLAPLTAERATVCVVVWRETGDREHNGSLTVSAFDGAIFESKGRGLG